MAHTMNISDFLRLHGMNIGENAQERRHPGWQMEAYIYLYRYCLEHPSGFTTELVRSYAESNGLPPSNGSPWGPVIQRAIRNGLIEHAGYEQSSKSSRHLNVVRIWRKRLSI